VKIAIVGTGISGLVSAHLLKERHDLTIFEADSRIGGHTHTVDVEQEGKPYAVDTGFIVYNEKTYPHFSALLKSLGVETQPSDMSFGLRCDRTGLEWGSRGVRGVFAQPTNALRPAFLRMLRDVNRFNRESRMLLEHDGEKVTLGDYLCGAGYGQEFVDHYVIPMGAAIWSADPASFLQVPAATFIRFFHNHGLLEAPPSLPWRVVRGGSSRYTEKLVRPFADRIRTSCPVRSIRRLQDRVELLTANGVESFDHVLLAVHSDQALAMLSQPTDLERHVLGSIRYQRNEVDLHTDESLLPSRTAAQASWNYLIPSEGNDRAVVSYDMNRLQGLKSKRRFIVTLNARNRIAPEHKLRSFVYDHPVFDEAAIRSQKLHEELSGRNRTHYCGAYWGYGFHEDGVRSAIAASTGLGAEHPAR
jgi:predicted NAD/FAD-binding protein